MTNAQIAEALEELAVLYQLDGADQYRVLAYTNSARTIKNEGRSVEEMARNGTITELPGVGKTLEEKILALVETGEIPAAAKLKEKIPVGLLEISRIPGLGPKTVRRLHDELDVTGPEDLRAAAEAQKVRELKGLGPKVEEKILAGLDKLEAEPEGPTRLRLDEILPTAQDLVEALRSEPSCDKAEIAGSVRRLTETCHDIDLIATSTDPKALATEIAGHELVGEHGKPSDKGVKLTTNSGIDVDVRIVEPDAFGNASAFLRLRRPQRGAARTGCRERTSRVRERDQAREDRRGRAIHHGGGGLRAARLSVHPAGAQGGPG